MAIAPIRMVNLTAAALTMQAFFAAIFADISLNSTWTIQQDETTVPPGSSGDFAMVLRSPSGALELSLLNSGTQAAPSTTGLRLGINPDGSTDPILSALNPSGSSANFSGTDDGFLLGQSLLNTEFILIEWEDALMVLFKNATRDTFPNAWHWGKCWQQPIPVLENTGNLRLDGHVVYKNLPNIASGGMFSTSTSGGAPLRRRISAGKATDIVGAGLNGPWSEGSSGTNRLGISIITTMLDTAYIYASERVVVPAAYRHLGSAGGDQGWLAKYVRFTSPVLPPYSLWRVAGADQYMVIGTTAVNSGICIPIVDGFNPAP